MSLLASIKFFDKTQLSAIGNLSRWAFLLTFAVAALTLGLVTAADRVIGL